MQCCVDFCRNTLGNVSTTEGRGRGKHDGVSFHRFPSEAHLRAAWLKALGKQDNRLPESAVVCSQHFLYDDICETESGSRQLRPGSVPSTVLVCMICFETDSKMFLMSQYNLTEAYEKLTGYPLCGGGNLKQMLCVQCALRLRNFSRFREQSLRARSLMMELLEKHELITIQHIKMIDRVKYQLNTNFVSTTIGPDHWDLYVEENYDENTQVDLEESVQNAEMKSACGDESVLMDEDIKDNISNDNMKLESKQEDEQEQDFLNYASSWEHAYSAQDGGSDVECVTSQEGNSHTAASSDWDSPHITASHTKVAPLSARSTYSTDECHDTAFKNLYYQAPSENEENLNSNTLPTEIDCSSKTKNSPSHSKKKCYTCNVCRNDFKRKNLLVNHIKTHTKAEMLFCKLCKFQSKYQSVLITHIMQTHKMKPFACELCEYKTKLKFNLVRHMSIHTGEKPFSCTFCEFKCAAKYNFDNHMSTHTGEKPFACELCEYKSKRKAHLIRHIKRHTSERPFACEFCEYKFKQKSHLVRHMTSHTGEMPFACELCDYRCRAKFSLDTHMSIHTGEKPFACELCDYKTERKALLLRHKIIHTGEKPFACALCEYKSNQKSHLERHMSIHTGEKPFACELCEYKTKHKANLLTHIRTHTNGGRLRR